MASFNVKFTKEPNFDIRLSENSKNMNATFGSVQILNTGDYNTIANKPSIEQHILIGDSSLSEIGVGTATIAEIEKILYLD